MKPRSSVPLMAAVALLVIVPVVELWLLITVGRAIGVLPTLAILVVEALFGTWLARREGRVAWRALNTSLTEGRMPARELTDAALVLAGAVLLIFPGFLTDVLGLICLLPFTRPLARWVLGVLVTRRLQRRVTPWVDPRSGSGQIIEGEVVDDHSAADADHGSRTAAEPLVIEGELDR